MVRESTPSVDVFIENDPNGDKLVVRHYLGSDWLKFSCDSSGNLIIANSAGYAVTLTMTAATWAVTTTP